MPTYDYRCTSCGHEFEEFQTMSSDRLIICPKCAQPTLKRLMSAGAGLVFKGSGFYLTDYKKSSTSSSTNSKSDPKSDTKSETKPDTKQEAKSDPQQGTKPSTDSSSSTNKK